MKPLGWGTHAPVDPSAPLRPVQFFSLPVSPSRKWMNIACEPACGESLVCRPMVPAPSPIPAPQVGSFGPPTAALTGVVAVGSRPEHCARRFSKLACTSAESVSVHVPVPRQAAPHPEKVASAAGVAVSAMEVPVAAVIAQVPGQSIPEGFDITRPVPLPDGVTLTRKVPNDGTEKVAATWWSAFIGSEQAAVPEQSPCHPRNVE